MFINKVALAYSGGLDTSVIIPWLKRRYACDVVAVVVDVGQKEDFYAVREKAFKSGATECYVVDAVDTFAADYIFPALRAGAIYEGRYLMGTSLARPLIGKIQVDIARKTGCDALAHGCTGKGNDQVRFELAYKAFAPDLPVIAPWREWDLRSREDEIAYAQRCGIPVSATLEKPYSVDENLWHTSYEGGVLEDPASPFPDGLFRMTTDPEKAPGRPERTAITFEEGLPVAVDGVTMNPAELIRHLNDLAGRHGVGRVDLVENRLVGMKSRGVYETPAGALLRAALTDLEALTLDRHTLHYKQDMGARYADLVYGGLWFLPLREAMDAFLTTTHRFVSGTVTVQLYKGSAMAVARSSPWSLYRDDLATFGSDDVYDQKDAAGFINLWGLPVQVTSAVHQRIPAPDPAGLDPSSRGADRDFRTVR